MLSLLWSLGAFADDDALYSALARRDPVVTCHELSVLAAEPVTDLVRMAETLELPPWAPMRAAECVVTHHAGEASDVLQRWVVDEQRAGLAKLVLRRLKHIPEEQAVALTRTALTGPLADLAVPFVVDDARESIRAVAASHVE